MRQDDVALALIEARLSAARERRFHAEIKAANREARRARRTRRARRLPRLRFWPRSAGVVESVCDEHAVPARVPA